MSNCYYKKSFEGYVKKKDNMKLCPFKLKANDHVFH